MLRIAMIGIAGVLLALQVKPPPKAAAAPARTRALRSRAWMFSMTKDEMYKKISDTQDALL